MKFVNVLRQTQTSFGVLGIFCFLNVASSSTLVAAPVRVPLTGCTMIDYALAVDVGASKNMSLLVDSGSTTLAVAAQDCPTCNGLSPLYQPSSSAQKIGTNDSSQYGDGTGWSGVVYKDGVSVGGLAASTPFVSITEQDNGFFANNDCSGGQTTPNTNQGIMGFGGEQLANPDTTSYLDALTSQQDVASIFAIQMCMTGGNFWLGGFDSAYTSAAPIYTPLDQSQGYDEVTMTDMSLTNSVASDLGGIVVDTGTSVAILPATIVNNMVTQLGTDETFTSQFGSASDFFNNGNCIAATLSPSDLDKKLPPLTLTFAAAGSARVSIKLPATRSYLDMHEIAGRLQYCSGVAPSPGGIPNILGGTFMRSQIVIFDGANRRVGFAPQQPLGSAKGCVN